MFKTKAVEVKPKSKPVAGRERLHHCNAEQAKAIAAVEDLERRVEERTRTIHHQWRVFDTTLSSVVDFAYTFDPEGRFLYVNRGFGFLGLKGRIGMWAEVAVVTLRKSGRPG